MKTSFKASYARRVRNLINGGQCRTRLGVCVKWAAQEYVPMAKPYTYRPYDGGHDTLHFAEARDAVQAMLTHEREAKQAGAII